MLPFRDHSSLLIEGIQMSMHSYIRRYQTSICQCMILFISTPTSSYPPATFAAQGGKVTRIGSVMTKVLSNGKNTRVVLYLHDHSQPRDWQIVLEPIAYVPDEPF